MNSVNLVGRLTKDPLTRTVAGDRSVVEITVAVKRKNVKDKTDFIPCQAWGKKGEFLSKYFQKGNMIQISGHIETSNYTNKDGVRVFDTRVNVEEADFVESKASFQAYKELEKASEAEKAPAEESTPAVKEDPKPNVETPAKAESKTESSAETISYRDEFMNIPSDADDFVPFT